jgi:hypothetical protein
LIGSAFVANSMAHLQLPFWFLSDRESPEEPRNHTCAFSQTEKAIAYLRRRPSRECRIYLVSNPEALLGVVADLHEAQQDIVSLDVDGDGTGGTRVPITALVALAARLRKPVSLG